MADDSDNPDPRPIRWASRVEPRLIWRLYQADAAGIHDGELMDEVAFALLARCESVRRVSERRCPHCGGLLAGQRSADSVLTCEGCSWRVRWRSYQNSYKKQRLNGPRAMPAFSAFMAGYPQARDWAAKMRAVDSLIHAVHETIRPGCNPFVVPAAENLIDGPPEETFALLESLATGPGASIGLDKTRQSWLGKVADYRKRLARELRERQKQRERAKSNTASP
ncbi:MAG: hypothetical protein ACE15C_02235 [Phycisphaerae bacterium]